MTEVDSRGLSQCQPSLLEATLGSVVYVRTPKMYCGQSVLN